MMYTGISNARDSSDKNISEIIWSNNIEKFVYIRYSQKIKMVRLRGFEPLTSRSPS